MNRQEYFDVEKFTDDVIELLKVKQAEESNRNNSDDDNFEPVFAGNTDEKDSKELANESKARELLNREDIRQLICPFLKSSTNTIFEIAKVCLPSLISAVLIGKITFPLDPSISAAFFFLMTKEGIGVYCKGYE